MKNTLRLAVCLLALLLSACGSESAKAPAYRQISMEEAVQLMETETGYRILDVRTLAEYAQGHIPSAVCVPNETIGSEEIPELPNKEQLILIYCRSGNRSKQAAEKLSQLGYTNLVEFGGILSWTGETVCGSEG